MTKHALRDIDLGEEVAYLISDYPVTQEVLDTEIVRSVSFLDDEIDSGEAFVLRELQMNAVMLVPLVVDGGSWGLVEIYDMRLRRFTTEDEALAVPRRPGRPPIESLAERSSPEASPAVSVAGRLRTRWCGQARDRRRPARSPGNGERPIRVTTSASRPRRRRSPPAARSRRARRAASRRARVEEMRCAPRAPGPAAGQARAARMRALALGELQLAGAQVRGAACSRADSRSAAVCLPPFDRGPAELDGSELLLAERGLALLRAHGLLAGPQLDRERGQLGLPLVELGRAVAEHLLDRAPESCRLLLAPLEALDRLPQPLGLLLELATAVADHRIDRLLVVGRGEQRPQPVPDPLVRWLPAGPVLPFTIASRVSLHA